MTEPPPPKRQKKQNKKGGPIREDDPFFTAGAVTINRVTTVDSSGRQITKEIKVPLVLPEDKTESASVYVQENQTDFAGDPYDDQYDEEPVRPTGSRTVSYSLTGTTIYCSTTTSH